MPFYYLDPEKTRDCPDCGGAGRVPLGEHFISREMALDAGEPALEGASMGVEWGPCERCQGTGRLGARTVEEAKQEIDDLEREEAAEAIREDHEAMFAGSRCGPGCGWCGRCS